MPPPCLMRVSAAGRGRAPSPRLVRAGHHAVAFLAGVVCQAPTACLATTPETYQALGPGVCGIFSTFVRLVRGKLVMAICQCAAEHV